MPFLFFFGGVAFFSIRAARQDFIGNLPLCFPGFRPHCSAPLVLPPHPPPSFCPLVFPSPVFSPFRSATLPPVTSASGPRPSNHFRVRAARAGICPPLINAGNDLEPSRKIKFSHRKKTLSRQKKS